MHPQKQCCHGNSVAKDPCMDMLPWKQLLNQLPYKYSIHTVEPSLSENCGHKNLSSVYIRLITRVSVGYGEIFHEPKASEISRHISQLTSVISALFL